jgi:putative ABC transport system permease protein
LSGSDGLEAPKVVMLNRAMTRFWQGRDPVGSRISTDNGQTWLTVVGMVADVRQFGLEREALPQIYVPLRQTPFGLAGRVLVRTSGEPTAVAALLREAVRSLDPDMPIENVQSLEAIRDGYLATPRLTAVLLAVFAGLAMLVTLAGIAGVIATSVSQRTREFGLRMALGARREAVLGMVLAQGLALVGTGLAIGLLASSALTRALASYLYDTRPSDPLTLVAVGGAFLVAGALACLGPAWRATTIDPMVALRAE